MRKQLSSSRRIFLDALPILMIFIISTISLLIALNWQKFMRWHYEKSTIFSPEINSSFYPVPGWFIVVLVPISFIVMVILHEILHLLPAYLFKSHVHEISIGTGKRIIKTRIGYLRISIRKRFGGFIRASRLNSAFSELIICLLPFFVELIILYNLTIFISKQNLYTNGFITNPAVIALWLSYSLQLMLILFYRFSFTDFTRSLFILKNYRWVDLYHKNIKIFNKVFYYQKDEKYYKSLELLSSIDRKYFKIIDLALLELYLLYKTGNISKLDECYHFHKLKGARKDLYTNNYCWYSGILSSKSKKNDFERLINLSVSTLKKDSKHISMFYGTLGLLYILNKDFLKAKEYCYKTGFSGIGELVNRFFEWMAYLELNELNKADNRKYPINEILENQNLKKYPYWDEIFYISNLMGIDINKEFPKIEKHINKEII